MKLLPLIITLLAASFLAACESTSPSASSDPAGNGTPLGDSNVHVSGFVQAGGAVSPR